MLQQNVLAINIAKIFQALLNPTQRYFFILSSCSVPQHSDSREFARLLRTRRERPRSRPAEKRNELATPHSITSSAVASNVGGISRPSVLAAFRLIALATKAPLLA